MRTKRIVWIVVALVIGAAAFWWTTIKKKVVRDVVTKTVLKKTDSLYRISYDTSEIDELNGNVYLRNVQVKLDSSQWIRLVEKDSMPPVTIALVVDKITIKGLKELKLLNNSSLDVSSIILEKPVFRIDKWLRKKQSEEKLNDTLEIYKRLVGNFDFLRAKNIQIINGHFTLLDQLKNEVFSANGINVDIDDFLVDSTHNYTNIISYFIKQTRATINGVVGTGMKTGKIIYDSKQHFLRAEDITINSDGPIKCKLVDIAGLSTEDFISKGAINARRILLQQPDIVLKPVVKKKTERALILAEGSVDSLVVENASVAIHSKKAKPMYLKDVNLIVKNVKRKDGIIPFEEYANVESLSFSIGSVKIPIGFHIMDLNKINYPVNGDRISVARMQLKPVITRQQLKTKVRKQADMYTIAANAITLEQMNFKKLIKNNSIDIHKVMLQMNLHVFDDKTLPVDSAKKGRGRFPYEAIVLSKMPINIRSVEIKNSTIAYEEQAPKTDMNGTVFFTDVNGIASNITNIPSLLTQDHVMKIEANAKVMGAGRLQSHWLIQLNSPNVEFRVAGEVAPFPMPALSQPFENLSLTKIKSGTVDKLNFVINGNRQGSTGNVLLNYHDLKVELLRKNKEDSLEKKSFLSFIANADMRNKNESANPKEFTFKRDRYKSMFNLLWKSVFEGGKKTILVIH
jgi:hypothetical protein